MVAAPGGDMGRRSPRDAVPKVRGRHFKWAGPARFPVRSGKGSAMAGKKLVLGAMVAGFSLFTLAGDFKWYQEPQKAYDPSLVASYRRLRSRG